jgi:capsular polysaccharide transport system ATP-binding protein
VKVAIIGAGISGLACAERLKAAGCQVELFEKRRDRAMIMVSHSPDFIQNHCDHAVVLLRGRLHEFNNIEEGFAFYNEHSAEQ